MKTRAGLMLVMVAVVAACSGASGSGTEDKGAGYTAGPGPQGGSALYEQFRGGRQLVLHEREPSS